MVEKFYKSFKVRDYMDENVLKEQTVKELIDCSLGTNDFIDETIIRESIVTCCYELNKYPIIEYELLKKELIKYWRNYIDYNLTAKNIGFGAGVMGILRNVCEFLVNSKTKILGCAPQFPRFISEIELKRGIYEYYSLKEENNYKFDINDFIKLLKNEYDVIHIENPNNPTGQIIDIENITEIVKEAKKYNSLVIIDEAYGDYMNPNNSSIKLVVEYDNLVVLRSASKYYGLPNHRVGYLFASEEFIKVYNEITIPFAFSDLSANIFRSILSQHEKVDVVKSKIVDINNQIFKSLKSENYLYTSNETPIFTIKSNRYKNLSYELRKKGIIAEDCSTFINLDSRYARIRIPKEWEKILQILEEVL